MSQRVSRYGKHVSFAQSVEATNFDFRRVKLSQWMFASTESNGVWVQVKRITGNSGALVLNVRPGFREEPDRSIVEWLENDQSPLLARVHAEWKGRKLAGLNYTFTGMTCLDQVMASAPDGSQLIGVLQALMEVFAICVDQDVEAGCLLLDISHVFLRGDGQPCFAVVPIFKGGQPVAESHLLGFMQQISKVGMACLPEYVGLWEDLVVYARRAPSSRTLDAYCSLLTKWLRLHLSPYVREVISKEFGNDEVGGVTHTASAPSTGTWRGVRANSSYDVFLRDVDRRGDPGVPSGTFSDGDDDLGPSSSSSHTPYVQVVSTAERPAQPVATRFASGTIANDTAGQKQNKSSIDDVAQVTWGSRTTLSGHPSSMAVKTDTPVESLPDTLERVLPDHLALQSYELVRVLDGSCFPLAKEGETVLGRGSACDVRILGYPGISRQHARIVCKGGEITISDQGSANGTWVNGARIAPKSPVALKPGQPFSMGHEEFYVRMATRRGSTRTH